jgi:hypothetical protein
LEAIKSGGNMVADVKVTLQVLGGWSMLGDGFEKAISCQGIVLGDIRRINRVVESKKTKQE